MTQLFMINPELGPITEPHPGARQARSQDAEALAGLLSSSYQEDWDIARVNKELLEAEDVPAVWVIEDNGRIVATASERLLLQYPGAGYLHYVGADSTYSGRGLGTAMTKQVLGQFVARGLTRAVLETDDFRKPAVITYLRLGFVPEYRSESERLAWSQLFPILISHRS